MKKILKYKFIRVLLYILIAFSILELSFLIFVRPVLKPIVKKGIYVFTDSTYNVNFDKIKVNLFTGSILMTNFSLIPDIDYLYSKKDKLEKNLFKVHLDSLHILRIRPLRMLGEEKNMILSEIGLIRPKFTLLGVEKGKDSLDLIKLENVSLDSIKDNIATLIFTKIKNIKIKKLIIKDGQFDFLKPDVSSTNSQQVGSITFIVNNFKFNEEIFNGVNDNFFSDDVEILIDGYKLKLKDNIHILGAKKLYLNSKEKIINIIGISIKPEQQIKNITNLDSNIIDFHIDEIRFENADFKEIYLKHKLHLNKALISGMYLNLYSQKEKKKNSIKFSKDSIKAKIDVYRLFKDYLNSVKIDIVSIAKGSFNEYKSIHQTIPQTSIASLNVSINNFLIDSLSAKDFKRIFYSKGMTINMDGFKTHLKDSIHTLDVDNLVVSTEKQGVYAKNIRIKSDNLMRLFAKKNHSNFIDFSIAFINIVGFDFNKFFHEDEINIEQIILAKSNIELTNFGKSKKVKAEQSIQDLFKNFVRKVYVAKFVASSGKLVYNTEARDKKTYISAKYQSTVLGFSFNPYADKLTKLAKVKSVDAVISSLVFNTADGIYSLQADSLYYSTNKAKLLFRNLKFAPIKDGLYKRLQKFNKSVTFSIQIPRFTISNTNLSSALQNDSLSLKTVFLNKPSFELTTYPDIQQKNTKKKLSNSIKRKAINKLVRHSTDAEVKIYAQTPRIDSNSYSFFTQKRNAIDTIAKKSTEAIIGLKISANNIAVNDTTIDIVNQICDIAIKNMNKIAYDSLSQKDLKLLLGGALSQIKFLYKSYNNPKVDKEELFHLVGQFLPKINTDTLIVKNGKILYRVNREKKLKNIVNINFDLKLYNFMFDTVSIDSTKRILFSDRFIVSIKNSIFDLADSLYKIRIADFKVDSQDSSIIARNIKISTKSKDKIKMQMNMLLPKIICNGIDFRELYFFHNFYAENFIFENPNIKIELPSVSKEKKQKKSVSKIFLPNKIKIVDLKNISIENGDLKLAKRHSNLNLSTEFQILLSNFTIDSVTSISDNKYFIPIDKFSIALDSVKFLSADSTSFAAVNSLKIASEKGFVKINNVEYSNFIGDSINFLTSVKEKNRMKIFVKAIEFGGLDFAMFRFKNIINFEKIIVDTPQVLISSFKKENVKKLDIKSINVFEKIKKYTPKIVGDDFLLNNLKLNLNTYTDTSLQKKIFKEISLNFLGLLIDSTTYIDTPNLFYCKDFKFEFKNFENISKNNLYKTKIAKIYGSSKENFVVVKDVEMFPLVPMEEVQDSFKWRTTAISFDLKSILVKSFNYRNAIFQQEAIASIVTIDSLNLYTYVDRRAPHNDFKISPHLIGPIFEIPYLINIRLVNLKNTNIYYKEISNEDKQFAKIKLGNSSIKVINVSNDTVRIKQKDLYTIIKAHGYLNDTAEISLNIYYQLKTKGNFAKINGEIGECKASVFNSYTLNGANLLLDKGVFHRIAFDFKTKDTLAIGKMRMEYNDLKAYLVSKDTVNKKKKKVLSWIADVLLVKNDNPKYGIYPKIGSIAYIHDRSYSDIKMWIKALLSGIQSTIAFDPKDAKKIRKMMRKNKKNVNADSK